MGEGIKLVKELVEKNTYINFDSIDEYWEQNSTELSHVHDRFVKLIAPFIEEEFEDIVIHEIDNKKEERAWSVNMNAAWIGYQIGWIEGKLHS